LHPESIGPYLAIVVGKGRLEVWFGGSVNERRKETTVTKFEEKSV